MNINREYKKIFVGTNQDVGYDNPFLCFDSSTHLIELATDKLTYFHMPDNSISIPLSSAGFIEDGAIAGPVPYYSDKLWKKMADYKKYVNWGDATPEYQQTGVWLCAWLSGSINDPEQTPIWKERWYDPGYLTETQAYMVNTPAVSDIDAQMSLDPRCLYAYFHVGNETNTNIINLVSADCDLRVSIGNWSVSTQDLSIYNNTIKLHNFNNNIQTVLPAHQDVLTLNGVNQDAIVEYSKDNNLRDGLSYNVWLYTDNWMNIKGHHILSNNFRGGWNLRASNNFYTPLVAVYDVSGSVFVFNTNGDNIMTKQLSGNSSPVSLNIDDESFIWILDNGLYNGYKHLYKIDFDNNIVAYVNLVSSYDYINSYIDYNSNIHV